MDSSSIGETALQLFDSSKTAIYFVLTLVAIGIAVRLVVRRIIASLEADSGTSTSKPGRVSLRFFFTVANTFAWTVALYVCCTIYVRDFLPEQLLDLLFAFVRIQAVALVMLLLAHGISGLLGRIVLSGARRDRDTARSDDKEGGAGVLAITDAVAWTLAFFVSVLLLNVFVVTSSSLQLMAFLVVVLALVLYAPIHLYKSSESGFQLVNSVIGYFLLRGEQKSLRKDEPFMLRLEGDRQAQVRRVSLFHTSFKSDSGLLEARGNWYLLERNYGFRSYGDWAVKPGAAEAPPGSDLS